MQSGAGSEGWGSIRVPGKYVQGHMEGESPGRPCSQKPDDISALQIGSPVPFFQIPTYVLIYDRENKHMHTKGRKWVGLN